MTLFKRIAKLLGSAAAPDGAPVSPLDNSEPGPTRTSLALSKPVPVAVRGTSVSFAVPASIEAPPLPDVSDEEVAERAEGYSFVISNELPPLKAAHRWWSEKTAAHRAHDESPQAYDWITPFVSRELMERLAMPPALEGGPASANAVLRGIRALVRERRKQKESFRGLLKDLYSAAVLGHVFASLKNGWTSEARMPEYVDIRDFADVNIDYAVLGYQHIETLDKTDVKWLIAAFGEPANHQPFSARWPHVRQNAIRRLCWEQMNGSLLAASAPFSRPELMQRWMNDSLKLQIGYIKAWRERVAVQRGSVS